MGETLNCHSSVKPSLFPPTLLALDQNYVKWELC